MCTCLDLLQSKRSVVYWTEGWDANEFFQISFVESQTICPTSWTSVRPTITRASTPTFKFRGHALNERIYRDHKASVNWSAARTEERPLLWLRAVWGKPLFVDVLWLEPHSVLS